MKDINRKIGTGICLAGLILGASITGIYKHTHGKKLEREKDKKE